MSFIGHTDFLIEVQKGNIAGHSIIHKFGRNDSVPNGTWAFINLLGATTHPLTAATTVRVKAGNGADTAAGAGAREITIQGIDSNLAEISEAVATAGASASGNTTASFWRVHRAWVSSCGTYGAANTAAVVIENSAGGTDLIQIATEEGQTQYGGWTVPTGKTAYLLSSSVTVDSGKEVDFKLNTRADFNDASSDPFKSVRLNTFFDRLAAPHTLQPRSPSSPIPALTDIWWEARGSAGTEAVSVDFELLIVDD